MKFRQLAVAAAVGIGQVCSYESPQAYSPVWLPSRSEFEVTVILWDHPPAPGLSFWAEDGTQVASATCTPGEYPELKCLVPPVDVGTYIVKFSSDRSKGAESFEEVKPNVQVIEPAHVTAIAPAHGPEQAETNITLSGHNIGGARLTCRFTYSPLPGTHPKLPMLGCRVIAANIRAHRVSPNSAMCTAPKWPGPAKLKDVTCSREVKVQLSNDEKVWSQDPIVFRHDEASQILV